MWKTSPVRSSVAGRLPGWIYGQGDRPARLIRAVADRCQSDQADAGPSSGNRPAGGTPTGAVPLKVKPMGRYLNGQSKPLYPGGAVASNSTRTPEDTMPEPAPSSAILASHSVNRPGEVDRLNTILEDAGLGRPLGPPARSTSSVVVLPVSADPRAVAAALRRAAPEGGGDHYEASSPYSVHTVNHDTT